MPVFRMTVRYSAGPQHRYHVDDVDAASLADAMREGAGRLPAELAAADLVELRLQTDPDRREYVPG